VLHCDEETLSLLALGEAGAAAADEAHLAGCERCQAELAALRLVVDTARSDRRRADPEGGDQSAAGPDLDDLDLQDFRLDDVRFDDVNLDEVTRIAPPSRVWDQIAAATGVRTAPAQSGPATDPAGPSIPAKPSTPADSGAPLVPPAHPPVGPSTPAASGAPLVPPAHPPLAAPGQPPVDPPGLSSSESGDSAAEPGPPPVRRATGPALPRPRSWRTRLDGRLLAVAAASVVFGLLGGVLGTQLLSDSADPAPAAVVAKTPLAGLPAAPTASGEADVTESPQGRTLELDVRQLGLPDGFYQVWLIDPKVTKMVPVGVLNGSTGRFTVPAGVNLTDYPVVDVSLEPLDGNPAHSGTSVLRGTLQS
jgi:hypothetical protein